MSEEREHNTLLTLLAEGKFATVKDLFGDEQYDLNRQLTIDPDAEKYFWECVRQNKPFDYVWPTDTTIGTTHDST